MKAVLKNGLTVEIDTNCLFDNQYNLFPGEGEKYGKRIFDAEIVRIIDDARVNMGKCAYCGKLVKRGEEEQHFAEEEAKIEKCDGCFWWQSELVSIDRGKPVVTQTEADGKTIKQEVRTETSVWEKHCAHKPKYGGVCTHKLHRRYGINWFTPENTFFLKYPDGFNQIGYAHLIDNGFVEPGTRVVRDGICSWEYRKKIGSYELTAEVRYQNGQKIAIERFYLRNCRRHFFFRFENDKWFVYDTKFGWKQVKWLSGVPADVENRIKKIVKAVCAE